MILSLMFPIHYSLITLETVGNLTQKLMKFNIKADTFFWPAASRHVQCTFQCQYWQ